MSPSRHRRRPAPSLPPSVSGAPSQRQHPQPPGWAHAGTCRAAALQGRGCAGRAGRAGRAVPAVSGGDAAGRRPAGRALPAVQ